MLLTNPRIALNNRQMLSNDFNCHHSEWVGSRITDAHGVAAFDFATGSDCSQLVNGPNHRAGGVLNLVLTNVPDLCDVLAQVQSLLECRL